MNSFFPFPKESYVLEYGVHRFKLSDGTTITGVSSSDWKDYITLLNEIIPKDTVVVSPELITYTGKPFWKIQKSRGEIEEKIQYLTNFSRKFPETIFLLGTPTFTNESEKPRNSIVVVRNSEIIAITNKRSGATPEESENFDMIANEKPLLIPETNIAILICADMPTATMYLRPMGSELNRVLAMSGKTNLIGKIHNLFLKEQLL